MMMQPTRSFRAVQISAADGTPARGSIRRLLARLGRALADLRRAREHRRAMAELGRLDDRLLADIGIGRDAIWSAVRHGRHPLPPQLRPLPRRTPGSSPDGLADREAA